MGLLKRSIKYRAIRVSWHDPATSAIEAVMSRGGRECADLVEAAWRRGARFDAWTELFREDAWEAAAQACGIDFAQAAEASWEVGRAMPWSHVSAGVSERYLARERARAAAGETTGDCTFGPCTGCGACEAVGCENGLAAPRVALAAGAAGAPSAGGLAGARGAAGGSAGAPSADAAGAVPGAFEGEGGGDA